MRAGFTDKHAVARAQTGDSRGPSGQCDEIALETGHEDGKGGQGNGGRGLLDHTAHHLGITDHEVRRRGQTGQGGRKFPVRDYHAQTARVEQVADGLHLRQDKASLGCACINGDDKQNETAGRDHVAHQFAILLAFLQHRAGDGVAQLFQPFRAES